jgi:hypothetical protein
MLSREALLGATDVPTEVVPIPELHGSVVVRGMTAKERTQFEKKFVTERRGKTTRNFDAFREQICVFCCVDPKFSPADIEQLSLVRCDVIERIANVAMKLSGITEKDVDELGQSSETPTASSSSSSVSPGNSV